MDLVKRFKFSKRAPRDQAHDKGILNPTSASIHIFPIFSSSDIV